MRLIFYTAVFLAGFIFGSVFPSYSLQYQQRAEARYSQARIDLAPFRTIADRFHGGSMTALIQHHLGSSDPTFHAEGMALRQMLNNEARLAELNAAFNHSYLQQLSFLVKNRNDETISATWHDFSPALVTSADALRFATLTGLTLGVLSWALWNTLSLVLRRRKTTEALR